MEYKLIENGNKKFVQECIKVTGASIREGFIRLFVEVKQLTSS